MALSVALASLLALELVRTADIPKFSHHITTFFSNFIDSRDSGEFYVTHIMLLLGLSIPIWLSSPWSSESLGVGSFAGLVAVGVGDAFASIVGTHFGKRRIFIDSKKTLEGAFGGAAAMMAGWIALGIISPELEVWSMLPWLIFTTCLSSALEAVTDQFDNLFVSLHYFALIQCACK